MNTRYMYKNSWTDKFVDMNSQYYETEPLIREVDNGYILPLKEAKGMSWGLGGVLDSSRAFVRESSVGINAFGGKYPFNLEEISITENNIVFIGILPKHWGHFITDTLARMWFVLQDKQFTECLVAFCTWGWGEETSISGNYLEMFKYMGITPDRLMVINRIVKAGKIYIPEPVMGYETTFHKYYKDLMGKICFNALKDDRTSSLTDYDKIYFTRRQFFKSRLKETGEREIEEDFVKAGYKVLAPEALSLLEQIYYIKNCSHLAAMSGTITHNAVFANPGLKLTILNRTCVLNPPQVRINQLFDIDSIYIDVYSKDVEKTHREYGVGPILIEENSNLTKYFKEIENIDISRTHIQSLVSISKTNPHI